MKTRSKSLRVLTLCLSLLMVLSQLASCGKKPEACSHPNAGVVKTTATCTAAGTATWVCPDCGETWEEQDKATGHTLAETTVAATCTTDGYTEKKCTVCGTVDSHILITAVGHKETVVTSDATCTAAGTVEYTCEVCGNVRKDETAALGHKYVDTVVAAACKTAGCTVHVCSVCGDTYRDANVAALGHKYVDTVVKSTCTTKGYTKHVCSVCGDTYEDGNVDKTGHTYVSKTDAPDCTHEGKVTYTCTACGDTYTEKLDAAGHQWVAADCNSARTCSVCGYADGEKLGHTGGKVTCTEGAVCERCGVEYEKATGHVWADATCAAPKTCTVCGETDGDQLGHFGGTSTCFTPAICASCGQPYGEPRAHDWIAADCEHPEICSFCHFVHGGALGHTGGTATTEQLAICDRCGQPYGTLLGAGCDHVWASATCLIPMTCTLCKAVTGTTLPHVGGTATCQAQAVCTRCQLPYGGLADHVAKTNATCLVKAICSNCDLPFGDFAAHVAKTSATCLEKATCKVCSQSYGDFADHKWASATCLEPKKCMVCSATDGAGEHNWDAGVVSTPATCLQSGVKSFTCKTPGCNAKKTEEIPALGHGYKATNVISATCLVPGSATYVCTHTDCGCTASYTNILVATGHRWNKDRTCTEGHTCTDLTCNAYEGPLGHDYPLTGTEEAPTCVDAGYITYVCNRGCGIDNVVYTASAKGHSIVGQPVTTETSIGNCQYQQKHICADCKQEVEGAVVVYHETTNAQITKNATCQDAGEVLYTCTTCTATYTDVIAVNPEAHAWNEVTKTDTTVTYKCFLCQKVKTTIDVKKSKANVSASDLQNTDEVQLKGAAMNFDDTAKTKLNGQTLELAADRIMDKSALGLDADLEAQIGDKPIFNFTVKRDGTTVSDFEGGYVTVTVDYTLDGDEDPNKIAIWYIKDGKVTTIEAKYIDGTPGKVTFQTNHFSDYAVTSLTAAETCELYGHTYENTVVEATCMAGGYTLKTCSRCGDNEKTDETPMLSHAEGTPVTETDATCTTAGSLKYSCTTPGCEYYRSVVIPAISHVWVTDTDSYVTASCQKNGYVKYICSNPGCTDSYSNVLPALNHDYPEATKVVVPVTCTADGYTRNVCANCGNVEEYDIVAHPGHQYLLDAAQSVAATCMATGTNVMACTCGASYTVDLPILAHNYVVTSETEPDCTVDGVIHYACSTPDCTAAYDKYVAALGHNVVKDATKCIAPTCIATGSDAYACVNCDYVEYRTVNATGHNVVYDKAASYGPTCTATGADVMKCTNAGCTYKRVDTIAKLAHPYVVTVTPNGRFNIGYTTHVCSVCGDTYYDAYTAATDAHVIVNGSCTHCTAKMDIAATLVTDNITPTIDGLAHEAVWQSAQTIDGVKVLWGNDGFYFIADKTTASFSWKEADSATTQTVTVANGVVTAPAGSSYAVNEVAEIFVPFNYFTENYDGWYAYGFVQERTQGSHQTAFGNYTNVYTVSYYYDEGGYTYGGTWTVKQAIKNSAGSLDVYTYEKSNDIVGKTFTFNTTTVKYAGPYGYSNMINGNTGVEWDDSQTTGVSKPMRELIDLRDGATNIVINDSDLPFKIQSFTDPNYSATDFAFYCTSYDSDGNPMPRYGNIPAQFAYAAYVDDTTKPIIDGNVDDVWESTAKMVTLNEIDDPKWDAYGYISVLWSDTGLYYLAAVKDNTVVYNADGVGDRANFYVSETFGGTNAPTTFPTNTDLMGEYKPYSITVGAGGKLIGKEGKSYYTSLPVLNADGVQYAAKAYSDGYYVEAYVPYFALNSTTAVVGHVMGLSASIDNYTGENGNYSRDEYTNLGGLSSYWSNPQSQFQVVFVGKLYDAK